MSVLDYIYSLLTVEEQTTEELTKKANRTLPKGMHIRSRENVLHHLNNLTFQGKVKATDGTKNKKRTTFWSLK